MDPLRLSELLRGFEGKWVALKWVALKEGEVIAAADNSDALFMQLRAKKIRNASVLRVPTQQEHRAELVGLG